MTGIIESAGAPYWTVIKLRVPVVHSSLLKGIHRNRGNHPRKHCSQVVFVATDIAVF